MLILFDQSTPVGIREVLVGHTVRTAREEGWSTLLNGKLLQAAEDAGFDLLLTTDQNLVHQQNLRKFRIAVVAINRNRWSLIQPALRRISDAVNAAQAGSYTLVEV